MFYIMQVTAGGPDNSMVMYTCYISHAGATTLHGPLLLSQGTDHSVHGLLFQLSCSVGREEGLSTEPSSKPGGDSKSGVVCKCQVMKKSLPDFPSDYQ